MKSLLKWAYYKAIGGPPVYIDDYKHQIKKHLGSNPVILEAGACDGRDTLQIATLWPKSKIHSFEPIQELFETAQLKLRGKDMVTFYPFALSDKTGLATIHKSSGLSEGSSSILSPARHLEMHPDVKFETTLEVQTYTIDDWAMRYGIDHIDFMWLDMQGAEFKVLKSSPKIFSTVKVLFTEVSLIETYEGVLLYPEFKKWLEKQGFFVIMEDLPYKDMGNVLFVRN
jgi:FkbM family methyltransferase